MQRLLVSADVARQVYTLSSIAHTLSFFRVLFASFPSLFLYISVISVTFIISLSAVNLFLPVPTPPRWPSG